MAASRSSSRRPFAPTLLLLGVARLASACGEASAGDNDVLAPADAATHDAQSAALTADAGTTAPNGSDAAIDAGSPAFDASSPASDASGFGREASTPAIDSAAPLADAGAVSTSDASATADASAAACERGFCSGFEDQTGSGLSGAWRTSTPNCSGDGSASIDTSVVHSGQRSLRIRSGGGVCNHIFATPSFDLKPLSGSLWVRLYVRFESAFKDDHVTFLALHDEVSQKDLRMGGQKQIFMWNRERDDATLPELSPNGVSMSVGPKPGSWHCIEFQLQGDRGLLDTYVDGALVPGLVIDGTETHDIDGQWLRPGPFSARVTDLRLGWESYGNQAMTLWLDDVAIGDQRPGC